MEKNFSKDKALLKLRESGVECATDEASLSAAAVDHMRYFFKPYAVIKIRRDADIGAALKVATEFGIAVHIRGSGTGCACGALAACGGWVMDLSQLNFIEIDAVSRVAHVGAGAITADIDAAAGKFGLFYAPDPSSHKFCSIGGNIACNAGGLRAAKYGTTRENTLALSAYLADGTRVKCGLPLRKYSCGMNLRDFFIGSEGTLGVVSEAWLKLLPKPKSKGSVLAFFKSDAAAFEGIEKFLLKGFEPAVLEFMDTETVSSLRMYAENFGTIPEGSAALLAQFDGDEAEVKNECARLADFYGTLKNCEIRTAKNDAEEEELWRVRRVSSQAMYMLADTKISQDIVLPVSSLTEFFEKFKAAGKAENLPTPVFGHARDGNYHIHVMYNRGETGARERAVKLGDWATELSIKLRGAVSGEHGIGILKAKYMELQHSESELDLMRRIKSALDPRDILNRGVLKKFDFGGMEPVKVRLPWDK